MAENGILMGDLLLEQNAEIVFTIVNTVLSHPHKYGHTTYPIHRL